MTTTVYVETSIPSFYHEIRTDPEMLARRQWTRESWQYAPARYELVTSPAVVSELERGDYPSRAACLDLIATLPLLAVEPAVVEIAETYIARQVMPADPAGDALHLALASFHRCDFLVTWNVSISRTQTSSATSGA
jgi:predicted nucleic acid-binding protein